MVKIRIVAQNVRSWCIVGSLLPDWSTHEKIGKKLTLYHLLMSLFCNKIEISRVVQRETTKKRKHSSAIYLDRDQKQR